MPSPETEPAWPADGSRYRVPKIVWFLLALVLLIVVAFLWFVFFVPLNVADNWGS